MDKNASDSQGASRRLVLALTALALIAAAALVLLSTLGSTPRSDVRSARGTPIPQSDGAPAGEAYVLLTDLDSSLIDRGTVAADLSSYVEIVSAESIEALASANSEFGDVEVMAWEKGPQPDADGDSLSVCHGRRANYPWQRSGSSYCLAAGYDLTAPLVLQGAQNTPHGSMARLTIFNAPPEAHWMVVTTELGDLIVANVLNDASHAEWLTGEHGTLRSVSMLDETLAEVWFEDDFTGPPPMERVPGHET